MLLVIMQHTGSRLDLGMITICKTDVPLFFICSGFLAYKPHIDYKLQLKKICRRILLPFICASMFASLFFMESPLEILKSVGKRGYWFLEALFLIYIIYYILRYIAGHSTIYLVGLTLIVESCLIAFSKFGPEEIDNIFGISYITRYFPCFITGVWLAQRQIGQINKGLSTILLIITLGAFLIPSKGNLNFLLHITGYLSSAIFLFYLIKEADNHLPSPMAKYIVIVGKYSLDIYLIHFFLVPYFGHISDYFIFNLLATFGISLIVAALCILISKTISKATSLGFILNR